MSIFKGLSSDFNVRSYVCTHKHLIDYFSWYRWEWNEWASLSLGSLRAFYIDLEDNECTVWAISNSSKQTNLKKPCILSAQFNSVTQLCQTLCDPMDCSTPGFPVHHQFPELAQIHVHQVGDAIQPSYSLSSPSPPDPSPPSIKVFSNESTLRMR